jgi:hypothetical protein
MAVGVVTPTVPVANDIILGEFKLYANYGLATELLLGATRGGAKLNIERKINEMKFDGAYGQQLDSAGIPLVRYDTINANLSVEQLYLKYFNRKVISNCESSFVSQDWALTGGTYTQESTIVAQGSYSAKMTAATTAHGIHEVFTSSKNLSVFDNTDASDTSDYIGYNVYITSQDKTDLGTSKLRLTFACDAIDVVTNHFWYDLAAADLTADRWNKILVLKSAFTSVGSPNWNAITGIGFSLNGAPSAEVIAYIDGIMLVEAQTNSAIVPINGGGGFTYATGGSYRTITPSLEITEDDYYHNIALIGQRHDGKKVKIILKDVLNDGNISLAFKEKDEIVNTTQFSGHYKTSSPTVSMIEIYEYV